MNKLLLVRKNAGIRKNTFIAEQDQSIGPYPLSSGAAASELANGVGGCDDAESDGHRVHCTFDLQQRISVRLRSPFFVFLSDYFDIVGSIAEMLCACESGD